MFNFDDKTMLNCDYKYRKLNTICRMQDNNQQVKCRFFHVTKYGVGRVFSSSTESGLFLLAIIYIRVYLVMEYWC